jgi:hypothetical protein
MNLGYPGSYSRNGDCIIAARLVRSTDAAGPKFGAGVILNADNTYTDVANFIAAPLSGSMTAAKFCGIAVREVKSATTYSPAPTTGSYLPGQTCDVLERGSAVVTCFNGTPTAGGAVYLRTALNGAIPAGVVGGFEAAADGGNSVLLTNAVWTTGAIDGNYVAELTILSRLAP